eukprot:gene12063-10409_t
MPSFAADLGSVACYAIGWGLLSLLSREAARRGLQGKTMLQWSRKPASMEWEQWHSTVLSLGHSVITVIAAALTIQGSSLD